MKLIVRVVEARNLPATDLNGLSDPYVRLQLGKHKSRTKVVKKCLNPSWGEEFTFRVEDLDEELLVSVLDEDKYFNDDFVGQVKVPVSRVFDAESNSIGTAWYTLQPKNKKFKNRECGEILLTIYFAQNLSYLSSQSSGDQASLMTKHGDITIESPPRSSGVPTATMSPLRSSSVPKRPPSPMRVEDGNNSKEEKSCSQKSFAGRIAQIFNKNGDTTSSTTSRGVDLSELPEIVKPEACQSSVEEQSSSGSFEEAIKTLEIKDQGCEAPSNLPGGVLLDQLYLIAPLDLNFLLYSPDSDFPKSLADIQATTELQIDPWKFEDGEHLKRVLTYVKAATKLVKAVKATEEQTYLKADGNVFAVLASVSTPDVVCGNTFKTEVLYCITPGPELPSGEQSSRLVISWRMNFLQSTMMKGMIEGGARQGLKESYEQYASLLSQTVKPVDSKDIGSNKEQILASLQAEPQSDWKLAFQYFANFSVVSTIIVGLYVLVHIWLAMPNTIQGLEFVGLDLPDSIGEVIVCGILVLQGKRVMELISRFLQARVQKGKTSIS